MWKNDRKWGGVVDRKSFPWMFGILKTSCFDAACLQALSWALPPVPVSYCCCNKRPHWMIENKCIVLCFCKPGSPCQTQWSKIRCQWAFLLWRIKTQTFPCFWRLRAFLSKYAQQCLFRLDSDLTSHFWGPLWLLLPTAVIQETSPSENGWLIQGDQTACTEGNIFTRDRALLFSRHHPTH